MKAWFIFKDGKIVGNLTGYTTEKGAIKSLVGSEDWHKCREAYHHFYLNENIPEEYKTNGMYKQTYDKNAWLIRNEVWSKKIWLPYMKKHYDILEKEFEIVFKD